MANFSPEEIRALKAGLRSFYVLVPIEQKMEPVYKADSQEIPKSMLDSLVSKRLVKRAGRNYKLTPEGYAVAQEL